ncbi:unnamed protein product, partial [Rotaria sp. Silwood1]
MANQSNNDVHQIANPNIFDEYINSPSIINKLLLAHIELEQIPVCKTVNEGLLAISRDPEFMEQLAICRLNADHFYDLLNAENVNAAPTVLFYHQAKIIDRVDGFNQNDLIKKIKLHINTLGVVQTTEIKSDNDSTTIDVENKIKQLLDSSPIILFMKGTPASPQCGFSRQACHLLDEHKIKYDYFDVLADENIREQLKKYSNWNICPQLYVGGELIGGLDIMKKMIENGDFELKLQQLNIVQQKDMRKYLETNITDYKTFDISQDENVRQKLKEYPSWQTYPQIYVNGQLIGGLDILKQLDEEGTLVQTLTGKQG